MTWTLWREYDPRLHRRGWIQLPTEVVGLEQIGPGEVRCEVRTSAGRELLIRRHGFRPYAEAADTAAISEPQPEPPTRAELLEIAKGLGIKGRSKMDSEALAAAIADAMRQGA